MIQKTLAELMVLFLLLISCARVFFLKKVKIDVVSIVPLIALVLSVLSVCAQGFSVEAAVIVALAFFVFLWNIRALLRLTSQVFIDHYGTPFFLISLFNLLLVLAAIVIVVYTRPVFVSASKFNATQTSERLHGTFYSGFQPVEQVFDRPCATVFRFAKWNATLATDVEQSENHAIYMRQQDVDAARIAAQNTPGPHKIILFMPNKRTSVQSYIPLYLKLAHDGFIVYTADFYPDDASWFGSFKDRFAFRAFNFALLSLSRPAEYEELLKKHTALFINEYRSLLTYAHPDITDTVFLAGDQDTAFAMETLKALYPALIDGTFDLATVQDYPTPGWGPVEQTYPLLARYLKGLERDPSLYMSSHITTALEKAVNATHERLNPIPSEEESHDAE